MKIKYEIDERVMGKPSLTYCPNFQDKYIRVGTLNCECCEYFKSNDKIERFIICNFKEKE